MYLSSENIFLLALIFQSFFFTIFFFLNRKPESKPYLILKSLMIVLFFYFLLNFFISMKVMSVALNIYFLVYPLLLCYVPFYYIYVKSLTDPDFKINKFTFAHFLPGIIIFILSSIFYFLLPLESRLFVVENKLSSLQSSPVLSSFLSLTLISLIIYYIQIFSYITLIIISLFKHNKNISNYFSFEQHVSLKWLRFLVFFMVITFALEIFIAYSYFHHFLEQFKLTYYILLFIFISFWGYFGLKQDDIYSVTAFKKPQLFSPQSNSQEEDTITEVIHETGGTHLSTSELEVIISKIHELVEQNKLYLDPYLTINDISEQLRINRTYISVAINTVEKKPFKNFINEYRINEAVRMLSDSKYNNLSIEGIAFSVGYISKATFNANFKKITGKTPAMLRSSNL